MRTVIECTFYVPIRIGRVCMSACYEKNSHFDLNRKEAMLDFTEYTQTAESTK